jgi:hypothetical protein
MNAMKEKYIKGFNHAYILVKHEPKLIESILKTTSVNNYIQGLKDGKLNFEQKRVKSRLQDLNKIHSKKEKNHDKGLEK